jgi:hypothetical protein
MMSEVVYYHDASNLADHFLASLHPAKRSESL